MTTISDYRSHPIDPTPDVQTRLLTQQQTADHLQVSVRTVRSWIATGRLPGYRVGAQIRVKQNDVDALLRPIPNAGG